MTTEAQSAKEIAAAVHRGGSPTEAAEKALQSLGPLKGLNALVPVESELKCKNPSGPLAGVPVTLKDNLLHDGRPCQCGSRVLEGYVAATSAHAVSLLEESGAIVLGRSNMDEFAMGSTTESSCFGPCLNPWDPKRVPGGSSGGAAALVAAGLTPIALGSSTGGSVRQPASYCGVVGLKPTYGRVSRRGLVAYASSLDVIAPLGASVEDTALALQSIAGPDDFDETSEDQATEDYLASSEREIKGLRIGILSEGLSEGNDAGVNARLKEAASALQEAGAALVDVSLPALSSALAAYYILAPSEAVR